MNDWADKLTGDELQELLWWHGIPWQQIELVASWPDGQLSSDLQIVFDAIPKGRAGKILGSMSHVEVAAKYGVFFCKRQVESAQLVRRSTRKKGRSISKK